MSKVISTTMPPNMNGLRIAGYRVRELWIDGYFDGVSAVKRIGDAIVEVYVGSDNGDLYFIPQAYVNDKRIGEGTTPEKAARVAEFRAMMTRAVRWQSAIGNPSY